MIGRVGSNRASLNLKIRNSAKLKVLNCRFVNPMSVLFLRGEEMNLVCRLQLCRQLKTIFILTALSPNSLMALSF